MAETASGVGSIDQVAVVVRDLDQNMESKGFALLQSGRGFGKDGDGAYAYFDTEHAFGNIMEEIELSAGGELADPERTYPE